MYVGIELIISKAEVYDMHPLMNGIALMSWIVYPLAVDSITV
jgi:hypothetical protein